MFIHLLLKANRSKANYRGMVIIPGSVITGQFVLGKELKLSRQKIRTALDNLRITNEITIKTTNLGSIIQIVNYKSYQEATSKTTTEQPKLNQSLTTNKKYKELKEVKKKEKLIKENAYSFLKINSPEELEIFEMQNKKSIPDYKEFKEYFNNKVEIEELKFKPGILLARLRNLKNSWNKNSKKEAAEFYNPSDHIPNA